jgi:hypothetical protein
MPFLIIPAHSFLTVLFEPCGPLTTTLTISIRSFKSSTCSPRITRMSGRPCRRFGGGTTRCKPSSLSSSSFSCPSQKMCEVPWTIQISQISFLCVVEKISREDCLSTNDKIESAACLSWTWRGRSNRKKMILEAILPAHFRNTDQNMLRWFPAVIHIHDQDLTSERCVPEFHRLICRIQYRMSVIRDLQSCLGHIALDAQSPDRSIQDKGCESSKGKLS